MLYFGKKSERKWRMEAPGHFFHGEKLKLPTSAQTQEGLPYCILNLVFGFFPPFL